MCSALRCSEASSDGGDRNKDKARQRLTAESDDDDDDDGREQKEQVSQSDWLNDVTKRRQ